MKHSILLLTLLLVLSSRSRAVAATALTRKEIAAGKQSIARFKSRLSEADEEDRRLYKTLTEDDKFLRVWSRSIADRKNTAKLKALIRASRKLKLWANVEWMLQALSEYEPGSPAYYRLSALSKYEQGKVSSAYHDVEEGIREHPLHRGLRRIWYLIYKKHKEKKGPKLKDGAAVKEAINIELCVVRSRLLQSKLNHYRDEGKLPPSLSKCKSPNELMFRWQEFLKQEGELPADYEFDYDCKYVCHEQTGDWLSVNCLTHGNRLSKLATGEKIYQGRLIAHEVEETLIREVMISESQVYEQKALEYLLLRELKLNNADENKVLSLLNNPEVSSSVLNRHLQAIVHYLRRYKASKKLETALQEKARQLKRANGTLCLLALYWCGSKPKKLSDEQLMLLLPMDGVRDLVKLPGGRSDIEKLIYDTMLLAGSKAVGRLKKLARKLDLPGSMAESNLRNHFSRKK
mgnify:CR=1 FL=1